jgi:quercetin dioxygenase-like cupin family protein
VRRIATCLIFVAFADCLPGQQSKPVPVMRLYSASDGPALADTFDLKMTPSATYAFAEQSEAFKASGIQFLRLARGKVQDWHNPAHRQYILVLKGKCEVEIEGGKKLLMTPGQIVLLEDVAGKGHITRSIGSEDLLMAAVPLM